MEGKGGNIFIYIISFIVLFWVFLPDNDTTIDSVSRVEEVRAEAGYCGRDASEPFGTYGHAIIRVYNRTDEFINAFVQFEYLDENGHRIETDFASIPLSAHGYESETVTTYIGELGVEKIDHCEILDVTYY